MKANQDKERQTSLKQKIKLILRNIGILNSFMEPVLLSKTLSAVCNAAVPFINLFFSARIINELAGARNTQRLITLVLAAIGLNLIAMILKSVCNRWQIYCENSIWQSICQVYTNKMLDFDYTDIEDTVVRQELTDIHRAFDYGRGLWRTVGVYDGVISGFIQITLSVLLAFSMFSLRVPQGSPLAYLNSPLAIFCMLAVIAASIFIAPFINALGGKIWQKLAQGSTDVSYQKFEHYFNEVMSGKKTAMDIRIYAQKAIIERDYQGEGAGRWGKAVKIFGKYNALSAAVTYLTNGLIYLYIALKSLGGAFSVGFIVQYVGSITQFGNGCAAVITGIGEMLNNSEFVKKEFGYLDRPNRMHKGHKTLPRCDESEYIFEFHDVSFKYPSSDVYALRHVTLKFIPGQRCAVVGMNGSGKTTMIKLLCRLYDTTEGKITLNGIDIKEYDLREYMRLFSVVFQDFELLAFTLGQNVAVAMDYDEKKAIDVLKKSGFDERYKQLPDGLDTYLSNDFSENGVSMSGGEAQKIALARALYKDAPFIVLDEPTAALDPIAEYEIYSKFNDIVGEKTTVYISHRLSSCRFCDDIFVFHEGHLVQRGSHDALVADEDGRYYALWNAQAQYYAQEQGG